MWTIPGQTGRVTLRGQYSVALPSGTMAAGLGAGSEIAQFRAQALTRVRLVMLNGGDQVTVFAVGSAVFDLCLAHNWTVDGSGGNAVTAGTGKLNAAYPNQLGTFRCASTAALTVGTKALDAEAMNQIVCPIGNVTVAQVPPRAPLWSEDLAGMTDAPLLYLNANEGFVIRATVPATGTWQFGATVVFDEYTVTAN